MVSQSCMICGLIVIRGLRLLVFILFLFFDHGCGHGRGRGGEGFGVTSLDEGFESLHLAFGKFDL